MRRHFGPQKQHRQGEFFAQVAQWLGVYDRRGAFARSWGLVFVAAARLRASTARHLASQGVFADAGQATQALQVMRLQDGVGIRPRAGQVHISQRLQLAAVVGERRPPRDDGPRN